MTTEREVGAKKQFVPAILPWIIAAAAAIVYVATLNRWVSFGSLLQVAKASGWTWQPETSGPLCWLLMYPLRWLPPSAVPLGVNLFSMVCAALTLALLARSVALLPQDRTQAQRDQAGKKQVLLSIPLAWLPPVMAALLCGFQLSFWENATSGSGQALDLITVPFANKCEMLDLLLFAYVIRCLLEFRTSQRDSWIFRACLVYGLAATQNWAMVGFFPPFLAVLVWMKGLSFFNTRFLTRAALWCLAGLSLYLLLPVVQSLASISHVPFGTGLKSELLLQKSSLSRVYQYFTLNRQEALLLTLTSFLPIFIISIRWASTFGDNSPAGVWLTTFVFHAVHALFFGVCIWVALDPSFSPHSKGYWIPCLTPSYLGALSVGYFVGYFLLVFGGRMPPRTHALVKWTRAGVIAIVWFLLLAVPVLLLLRNLPQIRITNGPMLRQYASLQASALPAGKALILSDDPRRLILIQSFLASNPQAKDYLFLDANSLSAPDYLRHLGKVYGSRWPVGVSKEMRERINDIDLMSVVSKLAASNSVYYVHPSFGYYFELFDPEPHGLAYKLNPCSTNTLAPPELTGAVVAENEAFWNEKAATAVRSLTPAITPTAATNVPSFARAALRELHLEPEVNADAALLGMFYSRAIDSWGVDLQRAGQLDKALAHFRLAQNLNPDNLSAEVNIDINRSLSAGQKVSAVSKSVEDKFGRYRRWEHILNDNGPFDDPVFCYQQGMVFTEGKLYRQAAYEFARVQALTPENLQVRLLLAKMNLLRGLPKETLRLTGLIHAEARTVELTRTNLPEVLLVELAAHLSQQDVHGAENVVQTSLKEYPGDQQILITAARVYLNYGVVSNAVSSIQTALDQRKDDPRLLLMAAQIYLTARDIPSAHRSLQTAVAKSQDDENLLAVASRLYLAAGLFSNVVSVCEQQVKLNPENSEALVNEGYAWLQLGDYDQAIVPLTHAMDVDTNSTPTLRIYAQLNRAVAYLRKDNLDDARRDYEALRRSHPTTYQVYYGLQEIAYRKKLFKDATRYCQLYLSYAPTNTGEAKLINARLKELRSGSR